MQGSIHREVKKNVSIRVQQFLLSCPDTFFIFEERAYERQEKSRQFSQIAGLQVCSGLLCAPNPALLLASGELASDKKSGNESRLTPQLSYKTRGTVGWDVISDTATIDYNTMQ
jgi:hypothetical protein